MLPCPAGAGAEAKPAVISLHRLGEAQRRPGAGALPGGHLALRHHLPGLPHAHATRQAGRGLRLRQAAAPSHLAQPGLHGPAAAVRDGRAVPGMMMRMTEKGTVDPLSFSLNFFLKHIGCVSRSHRQLAGSQAAL